MAIPNTAAKRANPLAMVVVTFIAPEVALVVGAEEALVRSGTGDPVAVACTPPITGPLSGVYVQKQRSIDAIY